jgi:hypothetical protein
MKKLQLKLAKYLFKQLGYKIAAIRAADGNIDIEGDKFLLQYVDVIGYLFNKYPIKRDIDTPWEKPSVFEKLSPEMIEEIEATTIPFPDEVKKQNETID